MHSRRIFSARATAAVLLGALAAACTTVQTPPQPVAVAPAPRVVERAVPGPQYASFQQYEAAVARRIFDANPDRTIKGDLQPLLRAVVILRFDVDGNGKVHNVRTWRSPAEDADRIARTTLHRAGELPAPPPTWLRGGMVEVTETWLIDKQGHFHLRALKPHQL
jgi:protein TonB